MESWNLAAACLDKGNDNHQSLQYGIDVPSSSAKAQRKWRRYDLNNTPPKKDLETVLRFSWGWALVGVGSFVLQQLYCFVFCLFLDQSPFLADFCEFVRNWRPNRNLFLPVVRRSLTFGTRRWSLPSGCSLPLYRPTHEWHGWFLNIRWMNFSSQNAHSSHWAICGHMRPCAQHCCQ